MSKKKGLALVKHLIKELSPKDRAELFPYLSEFPDSGVHSYDLSEELKVLEKHGTRVTGPEDDEDFYLVNLLFVRNLVSVQILNTEVLRAVFFPENFIKTFPQSRRCAPLFAETFKGELFTEEKRRALRAERAKNGIQESDAEFEEAITKTCADIAGDWMAEKAKNIAEQISLHLPGMVGDMMASAIKGQTFYDHYKAVKEMAPDKELPSLMKFKKIVQDSAWREIKPHLPSTKFVRTHKDWQGDDVRKRYARLVNDRRTLASRIKDMYEECEQEAGWIEDLKSDTTYERLAVGVPSNVIDWAIKRTASDELSDRDRQPLSIALEMARQELALREQDIETLHKYYGEGNKLLKADRVRPPSSK